MASYVDNSFRQAVMKNPAERSPQVGGPFPPHPETPSHTGGGPSPSPPPPGPASRGDRSGAGLPAPPLR